MCLQKSDCNAVASRLQNRTFFDRYFRLKRQNAIVDFKTAMFHIFLEIFARV